MRSIYQSPDFKCNLYELCYYKLHVEANHDGCSKWWMLTNSVQVQTTNIGTVSWTYAVTLKTAATVCLVDVYGALPKGASVRPDASHETVHLCS